MELTEKHIAVIREYIDTGELTASYAKHFGRGKSASDRAAASAFFKKAAVKKMVAALQDARDKAMIKATEKVWSSLYAERIATETELDIFHTKVVRGEIDVEEMFAVREKVPVQVKKGKKFVIQLQEQTVFKKVARPASIKEKQWSAQELYKRSGSYKPLRFKAVSSEQDDTVAAENAKNGAETIERVVILSNGEQLKLPD